MKDYKDTLNMPVTALAMKGGLTTKEPITQKVWEEKDVYQQRLKLNKGNEQFVLHDGPPYANGDLHVGHALNKILKDFVVRSKSMQGFYSPYIPGWDTHGLPIETAVTKKGVDRKKHSKSEFRRICHEYALEQIENQKNAFKTLSIVCDWEDRYQTLDKSYEEAQITVFAKMVEKNLIFKGLKPVYWSPSSESALAEAEIEYHDKESYSVYVAFKADDNELFSDASFVIWTTTPWTLPGNVAIAVNERYEYSLVQTNRGRFIIASEMLDDLQDTLGFENISVVDKFKGKQLEHLTYQHPLVSRACKVILGNHVTLEAGTGLVHTAPGHGEDDFLVGKQYDLEVVCVTNERGVLTSEAGQFSDLYYEDANQAIATHLEELGILLNLTKIVHSYPHDWRTKKPIIFRATPQWFASIDAIRQDILDEINEGINWHPAWGKQRLHNMIAERGDWCISRQRVWGVPIPVFYDESGSEILDPELMYHVGSLFGEHGSDIWFDWDAKDLLPKDYTHPNSPNNVFTKETDIMDVWFDSGSSHTAVFKKHGITYPAQMYLEGSDQYRGWFNSSLITGVAVYGKAPYENIVSHGWALDGKGFAMHKSAGNAIDPAKMIKKYGTDILRLWVASTDYIQDVRLSDDIMQQVSESYRKIRNTFRYLSGNTYDLVQDNLVAYEDMNEIDQYMMNKLDQLVGEISDSYNTFAFQDVFKYTINYFTFLSNFYLDYAKDILYVEAKYSKERLSVQTVLYHHLSKITVLLYPLLPHTMDEIYESTNWLTSKLDSCYLESFPVRHGYINEMLDDKMEAFFTIRTDVLKSLEVAREQKLIGKSLEAEITIYANNTQFDLLSSFDNLKQLFIVSKVTLEHASTDELKVDVNKLEGDICPRCWNVFEQLTDLCPRCSEVVENLEN